MGEAVRKLEAERPVIESFNPATGEKIGEVPSMSESEAIDAMRRVQAAQKKWARTSFAERAEKILAFRQQILDHIDELAELISKENGKTRQESISMELMPVADLATYFAKRAERILARQPIKMHLLKHKRSYLHYRPRGTVLIISPWNFPFSITFGEVCMALMAGNGVAIKPASLTPLIITRGAKLFYDAGLDPDLLQVVTAPGRVASKMIETGLANYVNFTGSVETGKKVAELCGKMLIPCSMELGGKDALIACEDADLERTARGVVWGGFANAGQVCASVERVYAVGRIYEPLVKRVVELTQELRMGNPLDDKTDVGAMCDPGQLEIVEKQVKAALASGAKALTGGKRPEGKGQFYPPTVLVDVTEDMEAIYDETFGPTLPIMKVASEEEAIQRANTSRFGLNAYVFTNDVAKGRRIAEQLEAGTIMINDVLYTHAAPETPWGGVKESGVGRVHSDEGLRGLCEGYHINYPVVSTGKSELFWYPYSGSRYKLLRNVTRGLFSSGVGRKLNAFLGR